MISHVGSEIRARRAGDAWARKPRSQLLFNHNSGRIRPPQSKMAWPMKGRKKHLAGLVRLAFHEHQQIQANLRDRINDQCIRGVHIFQHYRKIQLSTDMRSIISIHAIKYMICTNRLFPGCQVCLWDLQGPPYPPCGGFSPRYLPLRRGGRLPSSPWLHLPYL